MVAEKRTEGDIRVRQSGIPSRSGQDVQYSLVPNRRGLENSSKAN